MISGTTANRQFANLGLAHGSCNRTPAPTQLASPPTPAQRCSRPAQSSPRHHSSHLRCAAAPQAASGSQQPAGELSLEAATAWLEEAAVSRNIPTERLVQAFKVVEKAKLPAEDFPAKLGKWVGWQLVWTSGEPKWQEKLGRDVGFYIPFTAVNKFDLEAGRNDQGVFLGPLAAFVTQGACSFDAKNKRRLKLTGSKIRVRLGPKWFEFDMRKKADKPEEADADGKRDQIGGFSIAIANDKIIAGRGLSGGVALWTRVTPSWELSKAVDI